MYLLYICIVFGLFGFNATGFCPVFATSFTSSRSGNGANLAASSPSILLRRNGFNGNRVVGCNGAFFVDGGIKNRNGGFGGGIIIVEVFVAVFVVVLVVVFVIPFVAALKISEFFNEVISTGLMLEIFFCLEFNCCIDDSDSIPVIIGRRRVAEDVVSTLDIALAISFATLLIPTVSSLKRVFKPVSSAVFSSLFPASLPNLSSSSISSPVLFVVLIVNLF